MRSYCTVVVALVLLQGLLADHDHNHAEENPNCPPMSDGICAETCTESSCPESQICCANGCGGTACVVPVCHYNGTVYSHGSKFVGLDGCTECSCDSGDVVCPTDSHCSSIGCVTTNGAFVGPEGHWQQRKCTPCTCSCEGLHNKCRFYCAIASCELPNCAFFQDLIHLDDGCCPHCGISGGKLAGFIVGLTIGIAVIVVVIIIVIAKCCKGPSGKESDIPFQVQKN